MRQLLASSVDVVDTICVVEGYTFLVARSMERDEIPGHISIIIEAFGDIDYNSCDSGTASKILKVVFAVGNTLHTTSPGKLESKEWTEGQGREMATWVKRVVGVFSRRFQEDFEVMEVYLCISVAKDRSLQI